MAYTPPPASLGRLGTIVSQFAAATSIGKTITKTPKIFATLPGGQIFFDTDLELDTDGWPDGPDGDPSWQANTSLRYDNNGSVNSNAVPYFVLPGPKPWYDGRGVSLGDYAAVIFKGKVAFAVFADIGPAKKLGEGSIELMRRLGVERMKPNNTVINAGMGPACSRLCFPDRAGRPTEPIKGSCSRRSMNRGAPCSRRSAASSEASKPRAAVQGNRTT